MADVSSAINTCLFCRIVEHTIPAGIVYEDEQVVAFRDIAPKAPVHVLICPKKHIPTLNDVTREDDPLLGRMFQVARDLAKQFGVDERGYRTIFNVNAEAGQSVFHIHLHVLGGRVLSWP